MAKETDIFQSQNIAIVEFPVDSGSRFGSDIMRAVKEFQVGSGTKSFNANESGIWLGAKTFSAAPFSVDMYGILHASGAEISGYIEVGGAAGDVNTGVTTISGGKITANTITGDRFVANVSITSPIITGGTIQTSATGDRIILNGTDNQIQFKDDDTLCGYLSVYTSMLGGRGMDFNSWGNQSFISVHEVDMGGGITLGNVMIYGNNEISLSSYNITIEGTNSILLQGAVTFNSDIVIPLTASAIKIGDSTHRLSDIHTNSITLNGTSWTSWPSIPSPFSGNWSDISINTNKDMGGYNLTGLTKVVPHSSNTSFLGDPSYYWDWFYVSGIYGAGGTGDITIYNNLNLYNNDIKNCYNLDVNGAIDCEGSADINSYCSVHGVLYMNYQNIRDVADPVNNQDAANKQWVEANFVAK
jgi:hypothetical protein